MGFDVEDKYYPEIMTGCYMVHPLGATTEAPVKTENQEDKPRPDDDVWCAQA